MYRAYRTSLFWELELDKPESHAPEILFGTFPGIEPLLSVRNAHLDSHHARFYCRRMMSTHEADLRNVREELRKARRMQAVGRLAMGLAHDYNNKMQVVLGFAELVLRRTDDEELRHYIEEIISASYQASKLTNQLMSFSRKLPMHPCMTQVNDEIGHIANVLRKVLEDDIELVITAADGLRPVQIDPLEVSQLLVFLTIYVRQCAEGSGQILLETGNEPMISQSSGQEWTVIRLRDVEHLLSPKPVEGNPGSVDDTEDLIAMREIAERNGGALAVAVMDGEVVAEVLLPSVEPADMPIIQEGNTQAIQQDSSAQGQGKAVLVVDDDKYILDIVRLILSQAGYKVTTALGPDQAFAELEKAPRPFDLLVTDVVMPGLNGRQLYERIASIHPGIPVLYISGHAQSGFVSRGVLEEDVHYLQKPFRGAKLREMIEELLASGSVPD